jgi:hypothetical protein
MKFGSPPILHLKSHSKMNRDNEQYTSTTSIARITSEGTSQPYHHDLKPERSMKLEQQQSRNRKLKIWSLAIGILAGGVIGTAIGLGIRFA